MKKLLVLAVSVFACACGGNTYVINGDLGDYEGMVYVYDTEDWNKLDSAQVIAGKFTLQGEVEIPYSRMLRMDDGQYILYIEEPGEITITMDGEGGINRTGAPLNEKLTALQNAPKALLAEYENPETTDERRAEIESEFRKMEEETLSDNLDNYFGVMVLKGMQFILSGREMLDAIARFPEKLQQHPDMVTLKEYAEKISRVDIGQDCIEVVAPDVDGDEISLQSVIEANKYTLLDFWASWCGPCMGEVPHLKKAYAEFHDKGFEIYGYSFDSKADMWKATIEHEEMNWIHVSTLNGYDNEAGNNYGVAVIPMNFLIDAEGKIIAKDLRGEALCEKLAELLAE